MKLNIYEFDWEGDKDWVIAQSKAKAIKIHYGITEIDIEDYKGVVKMIPKKNWKNYTYVCEDDDVKMTFEEYMKTQSPTEDFFCSTNY